MCIRELAARAPALVPASAPVVDSLPRLPAGPPAPTLDVFGFDSPALLSAGL